MNRNSTNKWDLIKWVYRDLGVKYILNGLRILTIPFQCLARIERKIRQKFTAPDSPTLHSGHISKKLEEPQYQI
ncbi:hypothetical protein [Chitinophaga niabensis]|uniref:Uncharacterized protein n=1 Tax=Chitinophaga niabensis TaxID=536979 RepID=A0A1N6JYW5_9BACT|nr:hypothetical protein [Chitinophaga niabensis]SIO49421.1 hypothetical protein SAMN04488055_4710 [Chitinophaga niabensis]